MKDEEFDKLPWHVKNRLLAATAEADVDIEESEPEDLLVLMGKTRVHHVPPLSPEGRAQRKELLALVSPVKRVLWGVGFSFALLWAAVVGTIGLVCMICPPVGLALWWLAGTPIASLMAVRMKWTTPDPQEKT